MMTPWRHSFIITHWSRRFVSPDTQGKTVSKRPEEARLTRGRMTDLLNLPDFSPLFSLLFVGLFVACLLLLLFFYHFLMYFPRGSKEGRCDLLIDCYSRFIFPGIVYDHDIDRIQSSIEKGKAEEVYLFKMKLPSCIKIAPLAGDIT